MQELFCGFSFKVFTCLQQVENESRHTRISTFGTLTNINTCRRDESISGGQFR